MCVSYHNRARGVKGTAIGLCVRRERCFKHVGWDWLSLNKFSNCDFYVTCVDERCFVWTVLELNWCSAICISEGLVWQSVFYLALSSLLFCTKCVVEITQYVNSNHFHYRWIGRLNNAGRRTVFWGLGFEKIFKTQGIFKIRLSALLAITFTISKWFWIDMSSYGKISQSLLGSMKPPRLDIGWLNLKSSFRKRTMKVKPPLKTPKEISGFLKFPWVFQVRAHMSWTHNAKILELLQHYLKTFLNFEIPCVLKIFSKSRRVKISPATSENSAQTKKIIKQNALQPDFLWNKIRRRQDLSKKTRRRQDLFDWILIGSLSCWCSM